MKALVIVAHGSRRSQSNDEVRELAQRLRASSKGRFAYVGCGFLELAEPSIPASIQLAIESGADQVVVLPYFLSAGRHVSEDIPAEVRIMRELHPDIDIRIAPYLGAAAGVVELLLSQVE